VFAGRGGELSRPDARRPQVERNNTMTEHLRIRPLLAYAGLTAVAAVLRKDAKLTTQNEASTLIGTIKMIHRWGQFVGPIHTNLGQTLCSRLASLISRWQVVPFVSSVHECRATSPNTNHSITHVDLFWRWKCS
jgi:hypothetical protein